MRRTRKARLKERRLDLLMAFVEMSVLSLLYAAGLILAGLCDPCSWYYPN